MTDDIIKRLREAIAALNTTTAYVLARSDYDLASSPDNIAALLDRLDAAERENERLREDAERYRWLRGDACPDHSVRWTQWEVRCWRAPQWTDDLRRSELDAAIDAAMAAEQSDERREK